MMATMQNQQNSQTTSNQPYPKTINATTKNFFNVDQERQRGRKRNSNATKGEYPNLQTAKREN